MISRKYDLTEVFYPKFVILSFFIYEFPITFDLCFLFCLTSLDFA